MSEKFVLLFQDALDSGCATAREVYATANRDKWDVRDVAVLAYVRYDLLATHGTDDAAKHAEDSRNALAKEMKKKDLAEAQKRSAEMLAKDGDYGVE